MLEWISVSTRQRIKVFTSIKTYGRCAESSGEQEQQQKCGERNIVAKLCIDVKVAVATLVACVMVANHV